MIRLGPAQATGEIESPAPPQFPGNFFAPAGVFAVEFARAVAWKSLTLIPGAAIALAFVTWKFVWPAYGPLVTFLLCGGAIGLIAATTAWLLLPASAAQAAARLVTRYGLASRLLDRAMAIAAAFRPQLADAQVAREITPEDLAALREALHRASAECAGGRGLRGRMLAWVMRRVIALLSARTESLFNSGGPRTLASIGGAIADRAVATALRDLQLRLAVLWALICGAAIAAMAIGARVAA